MKSSHQYHQGTKNTKKDHGQEFNFFILFMRKKVTYTRYSVGNS
jgi:hypothetical protein